MLQRTRASQVEKAFREFREKYTTAKSLADAGEDAAQKVTASLGIHWRGPLLFSIASELGRPGGSPPNTLEELRRLTGVGPYTAAAWLSMHQGKRAIIVDSNVARCLSRMTGFTYPADPRNVKWVSELADKLTPARAFRDYNFAVLDFTMDICTPRGPRCWECPVRSDCHYGSTAVTDLAPR